MKPSLGLRIESDFKDFYDKASTDSNYIGTFSRYRSTESKAQALRWLEGKGTKTIKLKASRMLEGSGESLCVVYTDSKLHHGKGKIVTTLNEARDMYPNKPASKFYEEANGKTIKFLQIGSRRFRVEMQAEGLSLNGGIVTDIKELEPELSYKILEPIFSIDYISSNREMIAIDFNRNEELERLGFEDIMSAEEVIEEIKKSLISYNKLV